MKNRSQMARLTRNDQHQEVLFQVHMDAAFALSLRLRSVSTHLNDENLASSDVSLESRLARIEQAIEQAVEPHVSLRRVLNQCT